MRKASSQMREASLLKLEFRLESHFKVNSKENPTLIIFFTDLCTLFLKFSFLAEFVLRGEINSPS